MLSPRDVVKEVAKLIEQDNICYINRSSREITSFPAADIDTPEIAERVAHLEDRIDKYVKIGPMPTASLVLGMEYFIEEVTDRDAAKELARGLKRKHPTRNFLQSVESNYDVKPHWRRYKVEHYRWYVEQLMIEAYNY